MRIILNNIFLLILNPWHNVFGKFIMFFANFLFFHLQVENKPIYSMLLDQPGIEILGTLVPHPKAVAKPGANHCAKHWHWHLLHTLDRAQWRELGVVEVEQSICKTWTWFPFCWVVPFG
jgi:hypothetical protein